MVQFYSPALYVNPLSHPLTVEDLADLQTLIA